MLSPHHFKLLVAVLGALMLVGCGEAESHTLDTGTADTATAPTATSEAVTSGAQTSDVTTTDVTTTDVTHSHITTSYDPPPDIPPPDECEPTTCVAAGKTCGVIADGCEGELDCGDCVDPDICGGGGVDNVCGHPCVAVGAIFFDLGDTLVESDGGDLFVERPGAAAMVAELKGLGMRVGLITNTPPDFTRQDLEDLLVNPDLLDEFEVVLLSSEAASPPKPSPEIFIEAHGLLIDAPPIDEVAFVTENLAEVADQAQAPTQGARAAGMLGVYLSAAPASPLADYTIAPDQLDMLVSLAETEWLDCVRSGSEDAADYQRGRDHQRR